MLATALANMVPALGLDPALYSHTAYTGEEPQQPIVRACPRSSSSGMGSGCLMPSGPKSPPLVSPPLWYLRAWSRQCSPPLPHLPRPPFQHHLHYHRFTPPPATPPPLPQPPCDHTSVLLCLPTVAIAFLIPNPSSKHPGYSGPTLP